MTTEPPFRLTLGDCIAGMAAMADASVDHVITDPPFTQRTSENMRSRKDAKDGGAFIRDGQRRRIDFDGVDGIEGAIATGCLRVSSRWVIMFCALEQIGKYEAASPAEWIRATVWHRTNNAPQFTGDRPGQSCEGIAIMHRAGKKKWNRRGQNAFYEGPTINATSDKDRGKFDHPTVKPSWLMEALISDFTDPGDLILDPFMGSGTTGVAAIRLGRRFVGFERDEKYFAIAERRITNAREQLRLIPERTSKPKQGTLIP